ncbi:tether containing UBX domain for GLUT4-like isoform X2 [Portunus trituberculatus]|uniref:tether containing UBX domain for GLUT4-like isoform X2 n=1 Tax=Portunus trituberculatus TaxID=210409 RepID=UPI001E1CD42E|nr:tether containing UBX domain for GLUT4-like isoform X2 [Portunus trituberculatus]
MAGMSVTVLCPAGRRVNVKVTPNTSILQIIEEASLKQGLNPDQYDLKHLRRVLDSSSNVRHAGLPNRCQLEMVEAPVLRSPASVNVHIATELGLRLVHDFPCTTTLWEILEYHRENSGVGEEFLPAVESGQEVVLVYAMRRITCPELAKVTLRTLGLVGGKCMLRHSVQSMSSAGCQAHVSSSLARRPVHHPELEEEEKPVVENDVGGHSVALKYPPASAVSHPREEQNYHSQDMDVSMEEIPASIPPVILKEATPAVPSHSSAECAVPLDLTTTPSPQEMPPPPKVTKIGDHNAIVFSMADAPPTLTGDEDDAFFQLTAEEVRRLYKEQRKALIELQEAPLLTKSMREMEESSKVLTAMSRYPITHLRIHFPDEHVIQASFKPTDLVADVINFLRPFLACPTADFSLSTRHPHRTLSPSTTLVAADCVPNARLYYEGLPADPPFLSEDTLAKKSSYSGACSSLNSMNTTKTRPLGISSKGHTLSEPSSSSSSSRRKEEALDLGTRPNASDSRMTGTVPKVPKWFKVGK